MYLLMIEYMWDGFCLDQMFSTVQWLDYVEEKYQNCKIPSMAEG
jgi:hypothetical protein